MPITKTFPKCSMLTAKNIIETNKNTFMSRTVSYQENIVADPAPTRVMEEQQVIKQCYGIWMQ